MKYLTVSFPYSNDGFTQVFGGETAEYVCQGLRNIFEYIGGVPPLLIFVNAAGVGKRVGSQVHETKLFRHFCAHYGRRVKFCLWEDLLGREALLLHPAGEQPPEVLVGVTPPSWQSGLPVWDWIPSPRQGLLLPSMIKHSGEEAACMTPKMKATLDEEIHEAARKLFLSSSVADLCKNEATPKQ